MNLLKTSFFSAIITFIRISSGFVAGKVVAIFTGPSGVALIGAFSNFISIILAFANGAINTGVVKYTAEYDDEQKVKSLFSTSIRISFYCSLVVGFLLFLFAPYCATIILTNKLYTNPIRVLGCVILLYSLNSLLISILNGKRQIKTYTIVNTVGSLIGLLFTIVLVYFFKIQGALYALVLSQSIVFFVTIVMIVKSPWFTFDYFKQPFDKNIAKNLAGFSLMAIVSVLTVPVSQIILRNMLIDKVNIDNAGYWQGMMRISDGYLMIITTSLSTYYLPKISSLKSNKDLREEIFKGYKLILPIIAFCCTAIYFLRFFIIQILYTKKFIAMESLFFWQLLGDFFKIATFILGYVMVAKAMTKYYIFIEIISTLTYVVFGYLFVDLFKTKGLTIAFTLNYFLSFMCMIFIFRKLLFNIKDKN